MLSYKMFLQTFARGSKRCIQLGKTLDFLIFLTENITR